MSKIETQKQKCLTCGKELEVKLWNSINISLSPELKEQVKNFSIFKVKCERCDKTINLEYKCLYHDMDKKLIIFSVQDSNLDECIQAVKMFAQNGYTIRFVSTNKALSEKVNIFEANLKDTAIEFYKGQIANELGDMNLVGYTYFNGISKNDKGQEMINYIVCLNKPKYVALPKTDFDQISNALPTNLDDCSKLDGVIVDAYTVNEWINALQ